MTFSTHGYLGLALPVMSVSHNIGDQIKRGDLVVHISIMTFSTHGYLGLALPVMSVSHNIGDQIKRGDLVITTIFVPTWWMRRRKTADILKENITEVRPY